MYNNMPIYHCFLQITLGDAGIQSATCTCPRGQYRCHHMACIYLYGVFNVSCTDVECYWKWRKAAKEVGDYLCDAVVLIN